jgi:hypothetical protein
MEKMTVQTLMSRKADGRKVAVLAVHDYPFAKLAAAGRVRWRRRHATGQRTHPLRGRSEGSAVPSQGRDLRRSQRRPGAQVEKALYRPS